MSQCKVECAFPMVISSEFRMRRHRDGDYHEDAPHFTRTTILWSWRKGSLLTGIEVMIRASTKFRPKILCGSHVKSTIGTEIKRSSNRKTLLQHQIQGGIFSDHDRILRMISYFETFSCQSKYKIFDWLYSYLIPRLLEMFVIFKGSCSGLKI